MSISQEMNIMDDYSSYDDIPAAKKAWITIKAKKQGLNPVMVHAGIKAAYTKKSV